jgi:hypothetical protein
MYNIYLNVPSVAGTCEKKKISASSPVWIIVAFITWISNKELDLWSWFKLADLTLASYLINQLKPKLKWQIVHENFISFITNTSNRVYAKGVFKHNPIFLPKHKMSYTLIYFSIVLLSWWNCKPLYISQYTHHLLCEKV